jgi:multicomponent Na+:H+ antiporter subunit C
MTGILAAGASSQALQGQGVYNYWLIIALLMTGIYLVLSRSNMVKTIIGLNLFQVSAIMFYVSMGRVTGGTAPILYGEDIEHTEHGDESHGDGHGEDHGSLTPVEGGSALVSTGPGAGVAAKVLNSKSKGKGPVVTSSVQSPVTGVIYSNPLPHVLMLTAIVVGVATTALALSLVVRINESFGTIEEDELAEKEALL